jgi:hypothetical protein
MSNFRFFLPMLVVLLGFTAQPAQANDKPPSALDVPCTAIENITTDMDPPHLFGAMASCIKVKDYKNAAYLYGVGGAYGRYDSYRVLDQTAHTEGSNALTEAFYDLVDRAGKSEFREAMLDEIGRGQNQIEFCKVLWKIGKPTYEPMYMIIKGHNKDIPHTVEDGMVTDFDAKAAWLKAINLQWRCPIDGL